MSGLVAQTDRKTGGNYGLNEQTGNSISFGSFKPARRTSELDVTSFTSHELNYESELMAIYLGAPKFTILNGFQKFFDFAYFLVT